MFSGYGVMGHAYLTEDMNVACLPTCECNGEKSGCVQRTVLSMAFGNFERNFW